MIHHICTTCGIQFAATAVPPTNCPICDDERQYIGWEGQKWTTLAQLQQSHHNIYKTEEANLLGIGTSPSFAIGQRALLVQTPEGNLLWDCITLLDEPTIAVVKALGGIQAIAISHPHYYSCMVEWAHTFKAPIYLHAAEEQWVMRPDPSVHFWQGETKSLFGGLTLIRCGGHYEGGQVLHWPDGAEGKGVLLTGDILTVVSDRRYVSFMYSYPNLIPLPASKVQKIVAAVQPYHFDRIYGAWWQRVVMADAKTAVARSATRYINAIQD